MPLTGDEVCIWFYIAVVLCLGLHWQQSLYFITFLEACGVQQELVTVEHLRKWGRVFWCQTSLLDGVSSSSGSLWRRKRCWRPLWFSTSSSGLYYFLAAILTPKAALEGVMFSNFLSLLEKVQLEDLERGHLIPTQPRGSPERWVISMGRGSVWHSHLSFA